MTQIGDTALDDLSVDIRVLTPDDLPAAGTILADGMIDNPMHLRVFRGNRDVRRRRLLRFLNHLVVYVHSNGAVLGAYVQGELVGVLGMIKPGKCRPTVMDRLHFAAAILTSAPPGNLLRIHRWLAEWARNDPSEPHWHIGPMAVKHDYRRRGIGRRLMIHCCRHMDVLEASAWLETDLVINVVFYRSLGFDVVRKARVLGVSNWFMSRAPNGYRDRQ